MVVAIFLGGELGHAQTLTTWQDSNTVNRISLRQMISNKRVPSLMIGNDTTISLTHHDRSQSAKLYPRQGILKTVVRNILQVLTCRTESRFIDKISQVRPRHAGGQARQALQRHLLMYWCKSRMNLENSFMP